MTNITDQLPYELCEGVVATVDGIEPVLEKLPLIEAIKENTRLTNGTRLRVGGHGVDWRTYWSWEDVKKVFDYREGAPYCCVSQEHKHLLTFPPLDYKTSYIYAGIIAEESLFWTAVYLCMPIKPNHTPVQAFRVLYQCIKRFGG